MKVLTIQCAMIVTFSVLLVTSTIRGSEPKSLIQDILTNSENRWKDLHLLPSQLIGSMVLHNHPIVPFILDRLAMVKALKGHTRDITSVKFNSSEDLLLTASEDGTAKLWKAKNGRCIRTLTGRAGRVGFAQFNRSGDIVLTTHQDCTAKLWETNTGKCLHRLTGHTNRLIFAEFNNLEDMILTRAGARVIKLWKSSNGKCLQTLVLDEAIKIAKLNDPGDRVLTISSAGFTISPAGMSNVKTVKLWEIGSGTCLQTLEGHTHTIVSAVFNDSGDRCLTTSQDGTAKLWDTSSGECLHTLTGHEGTVTLSQFNSSGDRCVTASQDGTVKLWETSGGTCLQTLQHDKEVFLAKFNRSGDKVLTSSSDGTTKLWEISSGTCLQTLTGSTGTISSVKFTDSENILVTYSKEGTIKLWDTSSGKCIHTLVGMQAQFNSSGDMILVIRYVPHSHSTPMLLDISRFLKLRTFFSRDDSISLNQAIVLIGIYEFIQMKQLFRKSKRSYPHYYRRLADLVKVFSTSTQEPPVNSYSMAFDFHTCPHLQEYYEKLPPEIQTILDEYVRKTPPKRKKGANVEALEKQGRTPLHIACEGDCDSICLLLLEKGANIEAQDRDGNTPLFRSCWKNNESICSLLLDKKANPNAQNNQGTTPLHIACDKGYESIKRLLIERGAHRDAQDNEGNTPQMIAYQEGVYNEPQKSGTWV